MIRALLFTAFALRLAAQETPRINPHGIVPSEPGAPVLTPGIMASIYGKNLGPKTGCNAPGGPWSEVKNLCGVSVTVGGHPANVLYVQESQINFRVPFAAPTEGPAEFIVNREGHGSSSQTAKFEPFAASIEIPKDAGTDMPIWVEVRLPERLSRSLRYPVTIRPADFGGHQFEVKHNGVALTPMPISRTFPVTNLGPGGVGNVGTGGLIGLPHEPQNPHRLPLHLMYRFNEPGIYEVRYIGYDYRYGQEKHVLVRSLWKSIRVHYTLPEWRKAWLASMRRDQPGDAVNLVSDYLPSVLALPDAESLPLLKDAIYHQNGLVRQYAFYALDLFDSALTVQWIPELIRTSGPTPDLAYFLSWGRKVFEPKGTDLARSILPYLKSNSPLLTAGALQVLYFMRPQYNWKAAPEISGQIDRAVAAEADRLISTHNKEILQPLALYMGGWKSDASRRFLQKLIEEGSVREQAEICLRRVNSAQAR